MMPAAKAMAPTEELDNVRGNKGVAISFCSPVYTRRIAWYATNRTTEPTIATSKLYRFSPLTPEAPNILNSHPHDGTHNSKDDVPLTQFANELTADESSNEP